MSHLLISAARKSSGKTTVTLGLCAALTERGYVVQPFKKGPDYIDPMWLGEAAGHECHNLDFYTMDHQEIRQAFARRMHGADIALIEGNKGLYDGLDLDGSNSNAALATLLGAPVVLVIDARGMTRGIAPLILGYQAFDRNIRIAGVILSQLGGSRHEAKLRAVIEHYTDVPVLGAVHHEPALEIVERHLGLVPSNEAQRTRPQIKRIAGVISRQVDIERVLAVAASAPPIDTPAQAAYRPDARTDVRIAIARDAAFGFYYPGDLEALHKAGAELVPFDTLRQRVLPKVDGLFIGGGFPEVYMQALEQNIALRNDIAGAVNAGMPAYAECGGLMYLARTLKWKGRKCDMVGAIPADVVMHDKPMGRGYVRLQETGRGPWPLRDQDGQAGVFCAHEFHHSSLINLGAGIEFAYRVLRGTGVDGQHDGIVYNNLLASYAHLRDVRSNHWAARFVSYVRASKQARARPLQAVSVK
ncbi:MAG: cobyrinate a,c-diamide synthase [Acidiferrobacterales bacterium]